MNRLSSITKRSFCIVIVYALLFTALFSLDTENYEYSGPVVEYSYYGFPFFIDVGYQYRNNNSNLLFPAVGLSFENGETINVFANVKLEYRYERFYTHLSFKQSLLPVIEESYAYKDFESYGQFVLGSFFYDIDIFYDLDVGNIHIIDFPTENLTTAFQVNHSINASSLLYSDAANILSLETSVGITTVPGEDHYSYDFWAKMPYTFYHYWGELGIMPSIRYFQYFNNSEKNYAIGTDYLGSIGMMAIAGNMNSHKTLYNFLSSLHLEYKFYCRFLPSNFRSIYFVAYTNIGYGKEPDQTFDDGKMLYAVGGGIGYSFFGLAPLQITFGIDQSQDIVINIAVSTVLHSL